VTPLKATLALPIVPGFVQRWTSQLVGATAPVPQMGLGESLSNLLIVVGVFCGIVYFFFSKEHKGVTGATASVGIWVLMIGFGSTFGFTVMSRVSLLVGRFEFLLNRWLIESLWRLLFRPADLYRRREATLAASRGHCRPFRLRISRSSRARGRPCRVKG
jgi:hypothetical protein